MMKEEPSQHDEGPLIPATGEEAIGRAAPLLPETLQVCQAHLHQCRDREDEGGWRELLCYEHVPRFS